MSLFPPSTNDQYAGAPIAVWFLGVLTLGTLVPGLIHSFLPDGGAHVIAHLDVGDKEALVRGLFAWEGATQLAMGMGMALVVWRHRPLTPFFILMVIVERGLMALDGWVLLTPASGRHPPEHYASLATVPVALIFLFLSLRTRSPR